MRAPPTDDAVKRRDLRRMKRRATGLLLAATAAFFVLRASAGGDGAVGYAEAAAEAAMVGGIADWFAVTALFRHPLGLPIPHTAIIPRRKDQIGRSLGDFVQENFLEPETISGRVAEAGVAVRVGAWLAQPANARRIGDQLGAAIGGMSEVLSDEDVSHAIEEALIARARTVALTPLAGRGLDLAIEGGHHHAVIDAALVAAGRLIDENRDLLRARLADELPWWLPTRVDDRIFDRVTTGIRHLVRDVLADREHPLRGHVEQRAKQLAKRLSESPELADRGEQLRDELLDHPEVRAWLRSLWGSLKEAMLEASDDPDSVLRQRFEASIVDAGTRLRDEPELQAKVDRWLASAAAYAAGQATGEVSDLIATTVQRWDATQTGERIELQVGRDLQFIRINGTLVGGLAGVAIHGLGQLAG